MRIKLLRGCERTKERRKKGDVKVTAETNKRDRGDRLKVKMEKGG